MKTITLSLVLLLATSAFAEKGEYPFSNESLMERKVRDTWAPERLSNPQHHNESRFVYLVHEIDTGDDKWTLPYLENPDSIREQYRISSSVISQDMIGTYSGRIAMILRAPKENIGPMHYQDMASGRAKDYQGALTTMRRNKRMFPTFYPPEVLASVTKDRSSHYNEVLVMGTNNSKNTVVTVAGFLVQCLDESVLNGAKTMKLQMNSEAPQILKACVLNKVPANSLAIRQKHYNYLLKLSERYPIILSKVEGYNAKM